MKKLLQVAVMTSLAITLAACHTTKNAGATQAENEQAQAYAMGQKGGLHGEEEGGRGAERFVNELRAPSHQVYYFAYDQSAVSPADIRAIRIQGEYLISHPNAKVRLEGNTDDRGSREYNIGLGWRRAKAVRSVLIQQGVQSGQIDTVSYGKERPVATGENERAWSLNRRVELVYVRE